VLYQSWTTSLQASRLVINQQPVYKLAKVAFSSQHISAPGRDILASYVKWSLPFIISTLTVHLAVTD